MEAWFSAKKNSTLKSSIELDSVMYEFQILPFWNHLKNFTWSLPPSDSHPPVSPPAPPIWPSLLGHFFTLISQNFLRYLQICIAACSLHGRSSSNSVKYVKRYSLKLQTCASISSPLWGETIYWPQLVSIVAPVWSKHFNWKGMRWCTLHWSNS